jgi:alginate O-acetyltransferase complex protein AlgI
VQRLLSRERARHWLMLAGSVLAIYWLQPATPIDHLDFWLPTVTLALTVWVWALTRPPAAVAAPGAASPPAETRAPWLLDRLRLERPDAITAGVAGALVLGVGLLRYLGLGYYLIPSRPPGVLSIALAGVVVAGVALGLRRAPAGPRAWAVGVAVLVALLLVLKTEPLARAASAALRSLVGRAPEMAAASELRWLGFSYVAFRLMHVLRDRAAGRLPAVSLREFITYVIFFPAYTAGPIDRLERFVKDYRQPFGLTAADVQAGGTRLVLGVFKKFVLADSLALFALSQANALQARSAAWLWVLVYAYAWRLYLDFSGYTDIAIGLGRFFGIRLPENFGRPYLRPNLTVFWNNWHMSLTQWFRSYVFNPLTRALRTRGLPPAAVIFITQMVLMVLIGLWHGVAWSFILWGVWHGVGLFAHNRWADFTRSRAAALDGRPRLKWLAHALGVVLTFHYVALGWVWFALPDPAVALRVLGRLFGLG